MGIMGCDRCLFHPRCFFPQAESASDEFRSAPGQIDGMRIGHGCETGGVRPPPFEVWENEDKPWSSGVP